MRALFGIVSLVIVVAVIGLLAKSQLGATSKAITPPSDSLGITAPETTPGATVREQSQQIQQQIKQSVEATLQAPRPMPDEK